MYHRIPNIFNISLIPHFSYIKREIPYPTNESSKTVKYSIPTNFVSHGKPQASKAEFEAYNRFNEVQLLKIEENMNNPKTLWQACFQGISYAGRSYRNSRDGGLMIKEHDMVIFNVHKGESVNNRIPYNE